MSSISDDVGDGFAILARFIARMIGRVFGGYEDECIGNCDASQMGALEWLIVLSVFMVFFWGTSMLISHIRNK